MLYTNLQSIILVYAKIRLGEVIQQYLGNSNCRHSKIISKDYISFYNTYVHFLDFEERQC